ncbi:MAG: hypothetical protein M2R45_01443 [Verrucomicrobia subdivision 3 bacterium]|nr:hypothetical protein [Limisphaerales bacterium]MCS1417612.1 hypothetical protein [Limisphaerales bacterium]
MEMRRSIGPLSLVSSIGFDGVASQISVNRAGLSLRRDQRKVIRLEWRFRSKVWKSSGFSE